MNNLILMVGLLHRLRAVMESVTEIISPIWSPNAIFTTHASSVQSRIPDTSSLVIVSDIILDFATKREHDQLPGLNSLPAYMAAPPANYARQIVLILYSEIFVLGRDLYSRQIKISLQYTSLPFFSHLCIMHHLMITLL